MLGPPLGGFLYQSFGYEVPFIFLGCIVLLMVPLNMYILPNYGKITFITHSKNLKFKYFYAFVGDQFNECSLLFYIINDRFMEHPARTDSLFRNVAVGSSYEFLYATNSF